MRTVYETLNFTDEMKEALLPFIKAFSPTKACTNEIFEELAGFVMNTMELDDARSPLFEEIFFAANPSDIRFGDDDDDWFINYFNAVVVLKFMREHIPF